MTGSEVDEMVAAHCEKARCGMSERRTAAEWEQMEIPSSHAMAIVKLRLAVADLAACERERDEAVKALESYLESAKFAAEHNERWQTRAEKAEAERDEEKHERLDAEFERDTIARVESGRRMKAEAERDIAVKLIRSSAPPIADLHSRAECAEAGLQQEHGIVLSLEAEVKTLTAERDDYKEHYHRTKGWKDTNPMVADVIARIEARRSK